MFKRNGFDVIISDDLIGTVLLSLVFTAVSFIEFLVSLNFFFFFFFEKSK